MNTLYPVHYLGSHSEGYTRPQLFELSDGNKYLVKFKNNPQGTRVLVNDWVAGKLALLLGLPVAPFALVYFSKSHFNQFPELYKYGFKPGHQFASYLLKNCTGLWEPRNSGEIANLSVLPGVIVFDYWVNNYDRDTGNALLEKVSENTCYLHLIDHGLCFPIGSWTKKNSQKVYVSILDQDVHTWAVTRIDNPKDLLKFTEKVLSLPSEQIYKVINSIPEDWNVSSSEKEAVYQYLITRREVLPILMLKFIKKYFHKD